MNDLASNHLIQGYEIRGSPTIERRKIISIAWATTLLLGELTLVIARDLLGTDIPWIIPAWIGLAVWLFAAAILVLTSKSLRATLFTSGTVMEANASAVVIP